MIQFADAKSESQFPYDLKVFKAIIHFLKLNNLEVGAPREKITYSW